nr:MAG TPA: hypothetical protein [Caudoviricetes sp.]
MIYVKIYMGTPNGFQIHFHQGMGGSGFPRIKIANCLYHMNGLLHA